MHCFVLVPMQQRRLGTVVSTDVWTVKIMVHKGATSNTIPPPLQTKPIPCLDWKILCLDWMKKWKCEEEKKCSCKTLCAIQIRCAGNMLGLERNIIWYMIHCTIYRMLCMQIADAVQLCSQCKLSVQETGWDWTAVVKVNLTPGGWRNYHGFASFSFFWRRPAVKSR